jgi:molybdopterin-guanine dinucleotide biosynthesis protein A
MGRMPAAGLLLTGGASRRMGRDKAALPAIDGEDSLADRTARLLASTTHPCFEVGPGHSHLPTVLEDPPGGGPLAAVAAGQQRLAAVNWSGPALVVATDLPRLTGGLLAWLSEHPSARSVVPVLDDIPQTLCARYAAHDLALARGLVAGGQRSMRDLLERIDPLLAGPELWAPAAGDPEALVDVDTPADLARLRAAR